MIQKIKNLFQKKKKLQVPTIEDNISINKSFQEWSEYLFIKSYKSQTEFYLKINSFTISEFYKKLSSYDIEFLPQGHILVEKYFKDDEFITCPVCQSDYTWHDFRKYMIFNDNTKQFVCRECLKNNH